MAKRFFLTLFLFPLAAVYVYGLENLAQVRVATFNALGDELLGLWILDRFTENILLWKGDLFDGGVFFPNPKSLAFAETLVLPALFYRLVLFIVGQKLVAYHTTIICLFAANFVAMYLFAREFLSKVAAGMSAAVFTFSMVRLAQLSHIQLLPQFFFPLVALFIYRYEHKPELKYVLKAFLCLVGQFYCSIHLGLILAVSLIPYVVIRLWKKVGRKEFVQSLGIGLALFAMLVVPLAYQYYWVSHHYEITRSIGDVRVGGSNEMNYLSAPAGHSYGTLSSKFQRGINQHEKYFFIGFVALFLSIIALVLYWKVRNAEPRFWKRVLVWSTVFIVLMSMGPNGELYKIFYYLFPGMKSIRMPARFGLAYLFVVGMVVGIGFQLVWQRLGNRSMRYVAGVVIFSLFLLENNLPVSFVRIPKELLGVTMHLRDLPQDKAVAHLPLTADYNRFPGDIGNPINNRETVRMYYSLFHGHPVFNGYSGFWPPSYKKMAELERLKGASPHLISSLRRLGVSYVIINKNIADPGAKARWILLAAESNIIYEDESTYLIEVEG